jgi:hypothetical protein
MCYTFSDKSQVGTLHYVTYSKTWLIRLYEPKFHNNSNFCLNLGPKEKKSYRFTWLFP